MIGNALNGRVMSKLFFLLLSCLEIKINLKNTYEYFNIPCNSFVHITTSLSAPPEAKRLPSNA